MRIDFRRSVFLSIGLLVTGTLLTSDVMASPADAFLRRPTYPRSIDREAIAKKRIARQQRAARSASRQRLARSPIPKPLSSRGTPPEPLSSRGTPPEPLSSRGTPPGPRAAAARPSDDPIWQRLRNCEAGGRYDRNSGNGYYGAYQFSATTWRSLGYKGLPHQAPPEVQDEAARKLQARSGWGQWPACARRIGAR